MKIKKFKSRSMREALLLVKAELGPDAVILGTRKINGLSPFSGEKVEVTAALDEGAYAVPSAAASAPGKGAVSTYSPRRIKAVANGQKADSGTAVMEESVASNPAVNAVPPVAPETGDFAILRQDLDKMRNVVLDLAGKVSGAAAEQPTDALRAVEYCMRQNEVEPAALEDLMKRLRETMGGEKLDDRAAVRAALHQLIQSDVPVSGHIGSSEGRARRVALVGPTGVGKTTSIAKLASYFKLMKNMKVALIAADNYRIAAIEQIQAFADIAGIPVEIVFNEGEMRAAVEKFRHYDIVFIDTAGRSARNAEHMEDLKRILAAASPEEIHLVASMTTKQADLREIARRYGDAGVTHLIFTKLDETLSYGSLYNLARLAGRPVSYVTTGQNVPDDIRLASGKELANLIAGGEA